MELCDVSNPNQEPVLEIGLRGAGRIDLRFRGVLQTSLDLETWREVVPQPVTPWEFTPEGPARFYRTICP